MEVKHGTNEGWLSGCRDKCCMSARKSYHTKRRRLRAARGKIGPHTKVDSSKALERIDALAELGIGYRILSGHTGISEWTLRRVIRERPEKITARLWHQILAIPLTDSLESGRTKNPCGTIRRLRALYWMGYSVKEVLDTVDSKIQPVRLHGVMVGQFEVSFVHTRTHEDVKRAFEYLVVRDVPRDSRGHARIKRRKKAEREGWYPPGVWRNIDNPREDPAKFLGRTGKKKEP